MKGMYKSTDCLQLTKKLNLLCVNLSTDVVCSTTDSASLMEKMGNDSPAEYQFCFAHANHLPVVDVVKSKMITIIKISMTKILMMIVVETLIPSVMTMIKLFSKLLIFFLTS